MAKDLSKMIKELEDAGYKVKTPNKDVRHTFLLPKETLDEFLTLVDELDLKVKDAACEALTDWISKNRKKK